MNVFIKIRSLSENVTQQSSVRGNNTLYKSVPQKRFGFRLRMIDSEIILLIN